MSSCASDPERDYLGNTENDASASAGARGLWTMLSILVCHSYFLRFDQKQLERAKPYPPLATLQVAAQLRQAGHQVSLFDAMLATGTEDYERQLAAVSPQLVLFYEDNFNFLSKMCLGKMRDACCEMVASAQRRGARVITAGSDATDAPEPYLRAGADLVLLGEGLETLMAVIPRLDESPARETARLVEGLAGFATMVEGEVSTRRGGGPPRTLVPTESAARLGPREYRALSLRLARSARLFQPQHGLFEGLLVPLRLVREAHLGQSVPPAQRYGSRG